MPVSALPGKYSVGSFGDGALRFIDMLADGGFTYWQVLPFCTTDEYNSPYRSFSAFAGNRLFVDLDSLYADGLLTASELHAAEQKTPYVCEYERLAVERMSLLKVAASRAGAELRTAVGDFISSEPDVADACRFFALKELNGGAPWTEWTDEEPSDVAVFEQAFVQYSFFTQWARVRAYAASKGVKVIGDVPIYVSYDSADVYFHKQLFLLDGEGKMTRVAGVPPDAFSEDGQLWGNPIYDWQAMSSDGYAWWQARLKHELKLFDGVRIDHFRGLEAYWSIPTDAVSAREGKWCAGPGAELVGALNDVAGDALLIAEDLGVITEDVVALRESAGMPGMRVLQFAFDGDADSPHLPHNYVKDCVAYTGTHDNNTLLGWIWELPPEVRARVFDYFGCRGNWDEACRTVVRSMLASSAGIVIFPIQDLLGHGADTRINRPGNATGNWAYRVTEDQLKSLDTAEYQKLNKLYSR